jgi:hypothetical protein
MTLLWTTLGSLAQLALAGILFVMSIFIGGSLANSNTLGPQASRIVDLALFVLPALCVLSGVIVLILHLRGGRAMGYCWYLLPVVAAIAYLIFAIRLAPR